MSRLGNISVLFLEDSSIVSRFCRCDSLEKLAELESVMGYESATTCFLVRTSIIHARRQQKKGISFR